ncbi:hypothetical protein FRB91_010781 [Serendipita sp. 411]|nr:hypothetical protein FRB91_010781 [Serendipita sp. 411]
MPLTTHPHLRRLDLHDRSQRLAPWIFDANKLIYTMTAFLQITWFSYYKSTSYIAMHGKEGPSITLPNLEVLQYHSIGVPCLPYRRLLLPTLRHLTIHITDVHNGYKSLWKSILLGYGSTLRSVSIDLNSTNYTGQFLHKEDFPDWSQVPHLRYLKVTSFASLSFSLLPVTHPLRIFAAEIWDINNLFSCLDSENLQEIRMLSAIWDSSRRCFTRKTSGNSPSLLTTMHQCIDYYTMWRLWEKAASKGIVLRLE